MSASATSHMEHRWERRVPARIELEVCYRSACVGGCRTRDVSLEGAFVELDARALGLRVGSGVELCTRTLENGVAREQRHLGMVVHVADGGIGIVFESCPEPVIAALRAAAERPAGRRDAERAPLGAAG